jgi:hypothetical protein
MRGQSMRKIHSWILHDFPLLVERSFYAGDELRKLFWHASRLALADRMRFVLAIAFIVLGFAPAYLQKDSILRKHCRRAVLYPALPEKNRCVRSFIHYSLQADDSPLSVATLFNKRYGTRFTPEQMFLHEPALLYPGEDMAGRVFALPVLDLGDERRLSILRFRPALFVLEDKAELDATAPFYELPVLSGVSEHDRLIASFARTRGLDINLVRAIVFLETTHGWYDRVTGVVVPPRTIQPMNINVDYWEKRWERHKLEEPTYNIQAGTWILAEIQRRLLQPDVAKVATLYNNLRAEKVSVYGRRVEYLYKNRPWLKKTR